MKLSLVVLPSGIPQGDTIINTSYEVARDPEMKDIFLHSYNDTENKMFIVFDYEVKNGEVYYSRIKCQLESGPTDWGPIKRNVYNESVDKVYLTLPSPVNTPLLTTNFWETEHPHSVFVINSSPYETLGNSRIVKALWSITDLETGKVVARYEKLDNFYKFYVTEILEFNRQYKISCIYLGDNDNASREGSLIITTGDSLTLSKRGLMINSKTPNVIVRDTYTEAESFHEWYILDKYGKVVNPEDTRLSSVASFTIPENLLRQSESYIVQTREAGDNVEDARFAYMVIRTSSNAVYGLPAPFPYKLGQGASGTSDIDLETDKE